MTEKYKKKRWMLLFALLSLFTMMSAAEKNAIRVYEADGNSIAYLLSARPTVTFSGDELVLKADDVEVAYPLTPSVRFEFAEAPEEEEEEVVGIQGAQQEPLFKITADEIDISHIRPNSIVSIYNLSGQVVKSGRADSEGRIIMNSLNLPKGTYIVKTEQVTFKIFIK